MKKPFWFVDDDGKIRSNEEECYNSIYKLVVTNHGDWDEVEVVDSETSEVVGAYVAWYNRNQLNRIIYG